MRQTKLHIHAASIAALCTILLARRAFAEEAAPRSEASTEQRRVEEQAELEKARFEADESSVLRQEGYAYRRALHAQRMENVQGLPDEINANRLMKRRLFLPSLLEAGSTFPGYGGVFSGSVVSFGASAGSSFFGFAPRFDVRINGGWTLGGTVGVHHQSQQGTNLSVAPRIGHIVGLGDRGLLAWPRVAARVAYGRSQMSESSALGGALELALLVPLTSHAYVDVTPSLVAEHRWIGGDAVGVAFGGGLTGGLGLAL
jgi:hypothetical protein